MHGNLIDLFIVLSLSVPIFMIARPAFANLLSKEEFDRRRNLWLAITLIIFLSHSFWLYVLLSFIALLIIQIREVDKIALYFALLFIAPPISDKIPGGFMDQLFTLNPTRLLELTILLPAFFAILKQDDKSPFGQSTTDKLLAGYLLLTLALQIRDRTFTDTLREGLYAFLDVFLPYYVISRSLHNIEQFRKVLSAFVVATLLLSAAAICEYATHQLLYSSISYSMGLTSNLSQLLLRGDSLRALATTGQPIPLGFALMVGLGFHLFLQRHIVNRTMRLFVTVLLAGGLFASLSRGPWVGTSVLLLAFIMLGPNAKRNMIWLALGTFSAFGLAVILPGGSKIINLLPFIGKTDGYNVYYREQLLTNSLSVIRQHPILGSVTFLYTPEMQAMRQGQGIIDVVNSYLSVALEYGLVGLSLFASIFLNMLWRIFKPLNEFRLPKDQHFLFGATLFGAGTRSLQDEHYLLGVTLFSVLLAILVTIYTVSSITVIPTIYWAVAGMCAAYVRLPNRSME